VLRQRLIVAAALVVVAGCGGSAHRRAAADPPPAPACPPAGRSDVEGGLLRMPAGARASFLAIHGTADTVVPFNGKRPDRAGSVPRYTAGWARRDGCDARPRSSSPRPRVTCVRYRGCDDALRVELLRLSGTDHGWPGAGPPLPDHNPSGVSATRELLRFVAAARRP
jgi:poly(3-hydroxybutyrate) depolymerase